MRWLVERQQNHVDFQVQVEAEAMQCLAGSLIFTNAVPMQIPGQPPGTYFDDFHPQVIARAFAPGQWSTVERIL